MSDKTADDFKKWLAKPSDGHIVYFYSSGKALATNILDYVTNGINNGNKCILIAKPVHIQMLNKEVGKYAPKIKQQLRDVCRTLNAQSILVEIMLNGLLDKKKFFKVMATILPKAKKKVRPIKAYGKLVASLIEEHSTEGAMQLEKIWTELTKVYSFPSFCAYPEGPIKLLSSTFNPNTSRKVDWEDGKTEVTTRPEEGDEIAKLHSQGRGVREIARRLGRSASSISQELKAGIWHDHNRHTSVYVAIHTQGLRKDRAK